MILILQYYRLSMVLGLKSVHAKKLNDKIIEELRLLALSSKPIDVRMELLKPPRLKISLSEELPPIGHRSPLEKLSILGNPNIPKVIDRVYEDRDLRAKNAILILYERGIPISYIQRLLSIGPLGIGRFGKLVPTRWSITAVDSIISKNLVLKVKGYDIIDNIEVYIWKGYDNTINSNTVP
ncbi:MAG: hypothetical protein QXD80_02530 [Acidilobaceae archaeon]